MATKRSKFQRATKRRVQALSSEEFDEWRRIREALSWVTYQVEVAHLTVWGEEWECSRRYGPIGPISEKAEWYWPGGGEQRRDDLDAAYNLMLDPDGRLEVWDNDEGEMVGHDVVVADNEKVKVER